MPGGAARTFCHQRHQFIDFTKASGRVYILNHFKLDFIAHAMGLNVDCGKLVK